MGVVFAHNGTKPASWGCLDRTLGDFSSMDEIWVYHFKADIKEQSNQWPSRRELAPMTAKTVPSDGKIMAFAFGDVQSIIVYLQKRKNNQWWVLYKLIPAFEFEKSRQKRKHLVKNKALFQDKALVHISVIAMTKINELMFELFN